MQSTTVEEARRELQDAESRYREAEAAHERDYAGTPTAERVVAQIESMAALEAAAREVIDARARFIEIRDRDTEQRRSRARAELSVVEAELVGVAASVEEGMDRLVASLTQLLGLSKRRYAHRQEMTGRAPMSMLARNAAFGWVTWRLMDLELPGMERPPHHYRKPMAEIIGLEPDETGEEE